MPLRSVMSGKLVSKRRMSRGMMAALASNP